MTCVLVDLRVSSTAQKNMTAHRVSPAEVAAREELSAAYGHALSDAEWAEIRANLLAVFGVLAEWNCGADDVDVEEKIASARR